MKITNVGNAMSWFQVLNTGSKCQTAVMRLDANGESSEELNTHKGSDQVLYVIEGTVTGEIGSEIVTLNAGDSCIVPAGTPHRFRNAGKVPAVTFNVYAPPEYAPGEQG